MKTDTADSADPIIQRLRTLWQESPHLKDAAGVYEAILPLIRDADVHVEAISLTPAEAFAKMEKGLPLLYDIGLELDGQSVMELMLRIAGAVEKLRENEPSLSQVRSSDELGMKARLIRLALEEKTLDVDELLPVVAAGEREILASVAQGLRLDAGLLWILSQNALKPALRAWRRQLTPIVEGISWYRGTCFVCGADATLGELQGNNQFKHLRCVQCGADWPFRRLECMYCANEDHTTLGYLYPESQRERPRVEVCEKCKGYLKVITTFSATPAEMLPVEDLATLHLDYIAQERGYVR